MSCSGSGLIRFMSTLFGHNSGQLPWWKNLTINYWSQNIRAHQLFSRTEYTVILLFQKRMLHCTSHMSYGEWTNSKVKVKDDAIPFLQSEARKFKVDDAYSVDTVKDQKRQKYAVPLGLCIFSIIIYFSFIRDYGYKDKSLVGFLTKDIGDKLPDDVRERIYSKVKQSKLPDQTKSEFSSNVK